MKNFLLSLFICFAISGFVSLKMNMSDNANPYFKNNLKADFSKFTLPSYAPLDLRSADNSNSEKQKDWYSEAISNINKSEYKVTFSEKLNAYQSPNRENNMRFVYHKDGFTAMLRENKIALFDESDKMTEEKDRKYKYLDDWKIKFELQSVSKELNSDCKSDITGLINKDFETSENKISIENENLRIQYSNDEGGMRQDFIVKNKPEGCNRLRLKLNAETNLSMIAGGDALMFKDKKGDLKLKYSSLKCWDANGRELRAYFEKSNYELRITNYELKDRSKIETNSKSEIPISQFSIVVNDEGAVYPVTIDPLSSIPNWTAEVNQTGANFGWSVATAGDVNGDGYSDVIVGAPYYDNGQTDEGAVFVYHGSINGLSLAPNWSKEINQSSALFGWSVATAGDVNGDGYSDVIIGSPTYDSIQADEGRAYVYYGSAGGLESGFSWKFETHQSGENFGYCVSSAGDINNDGYSDILIGSPFYDGGENNEGRGYMFKGSSGGLSTGANWIFESNQADAHLGFSVAPAGDLNGEGFSDVLIGAYKYNSSFTNDGRVFVFLGNGTTLPSVPNSVLNGTQTGEYFGYSVSTAGDVNGDGRSDIIIGAPLFDNGHTDEGKCYLYLGSSVGITGSAAWTKESNQTGGQFGISVSTAGDMNGDGFADVILGGNFLENGQTQEGRAFVYLGQPGGLSSGSSVIYESNTTNSNFGFSVAAAGDINGDGYSDVIVGSYSNSNGQSNEGSVYVYLGSVLGMNTTTNDYVTGNQSSSFLGYSVSSAGDVNGDGYSDVIIGANGYDNGESNEGAAFVYYGSASGISSIANWSAEGNQNSSNFGSSVSTAGDVNGDGFSDVIIGAYTYDNGENSEGAAFAYYGSSYGLSATANWNAEGNQNYAYFGESVSTAGDVNGDGFSDVIIGAEGYDNDQSNEGAAFVFYGSPSGLSVTENWNAEGNQTNASFGSAVSTAGDVNGDGYSDVIIGAQVFDNGQTDEGAAFVYYGSASGLSASVNWSAEKNQAYAGFGVSVSSAGDVNADGYTDVIIGAVNYDNGQTDEGGSFVYHGSSSGLSSVSNWTGESNNIGARYGYSVSSAGDVNGDGYSDVIVGAHVYSNGQSFEGAVFIYHGSTTGLSVTSNLIIEGNAAGINFGYSVSSAGDINGEGYSDIIVGAYTYSDVFSNSGAAFVFYGGNGNFSGLRSTVNQYKFGSLNVVSSEGNTGTTGSVRLQHFAKSPFGKGLGRIVYDIQPNGIPFSGSNISNSTEFNSSPASYTSFGFTGTNVSQDLTGLNDDKIYKWRARAQYKMTSFPWQRYGPWRYYNNFSSESRGGFRPKINKLNLNLSSLIEGFYKITMVSDSLRVILRSGTPPYAPVDSAIRILSSSGTATYTFQNAVNSVQYYIVLKHRNSIETWSSLTQSFVSDNLNYNFTDALNKAYGNNLKLVDSLPQKYAIYSGDVNQDGTIDLNDVLSVYNAASGFSSGYVVNDVNGDNIVDLNDILITYNNSAGFVAVVRP